MRNPLVNQTGVVTVVPGAPETIMGMEKFVTQV
jgi:hypothetical protein